MFCKKPDESKFDSGRNKKQIEVRECLLPFHAESFIFQFTIQTYKEQRNLILPVVLYGCETWSLTLREERTMRMFENMVLMRIFGPKRDEVTGEWRRLHEELHDLYCSPNIIPGDQMRWAGHAARMGAREVHTRLWWGNLRERDHLEDPGIDGRTMLKWIFSK